MRVAIVGGGISGLAAARALADQHAVDVFEAGAHVGGHTHTIEVHQPGGRAPLPVDTGFIIYNERTYPLFSKLVAELGVATRPTEMSFSASCGRHRLAYGSRTLGSLFAQRRQLASPRHWRLLAEIARFFRLGNQLVDSRTVASVTLGEFLERHSLARDAVAHFVVPMGAAIWSTAAGEMLDFPVATFLRFYVNHGMLSLTGAPVWRTIVGGSRMYVRALLATLRAQVHRGAAVARIVRDGGGVTLELAAGERRRFDRVVIATHSDQALALLGDDATADERRVLGAIAYTPNEAWLHTDTTFLPVPAARAAWNYHVDDCRQPPATVGVTYWMNLLQGLPGPTEYLLTLNPTRPIAPDKVVQRIRYAHPRYDFAALRAQRELPSLQGRRGAWFAGAYHGYGFHEDGYRAGLAAAASLIAAPPRARDVAA